MKHIDFVLWVALVPIGISIYDYLRIKTFGAYEVTPQEMDICRGLEILAYLLIAYALW